MADLTPAEQAVAVTLADVANERLSVQIGVSTRSVPEDHAAAARRIVAAARPHIEAEALREVAKTLNSGGYEMPGGKAFTYPHFDCEDSVARWLKARAAEIEGGSDAG